MARSWPAAPLAAHACPQFTPHLPTHPPPNAQDTLEIKIYDKDLLGKDELIGTLSVALAGVRASSMEHLQVGACSGACAPC